MPLVLKKDGCKLVVGAYKFPDRKKIAICVDDLEENSITICGYFTTQEHAEYFMKRLAQIVGADIENEVKENG